MTAIADVLKDAETKSIAELEQHKLERDAEVARIRGEMGQIKKVLDVHYVAKQRADTGATPLDLTPQTIIHGGLTDDQKAQMLAHPGFGDWIRNLIADAVKAAKGEK